MATEKSKDKCMSVFYHNAMSSAFTLTQNIQLCGSFFNPSMRVCVSKGTSTSRDRHALSIPLAWRRSTYLREQQQVANIKSGRLTVEKLKPSPPEYNVTLTRQTKTLTRRGVKYSPTGNENKIKERGREKYSYKKWYIHTERKERKK